MNELTLVKHEFFEDLKCDIYQSDNDYYMTREQIGRALDYSDPQKAIANIHARNKERLDKMSVVLNSVLFTNASIFAQNLCKSEI